MSKTPQPGLVIANTSETDEADLVTAFSAFFGEDDQAWSEINDWFARFTAWRSRGDGEELLYPLPDDVQADYEGIFHGLIVGLNGIASPGYYFGQDELIGDFFGFWPCAEGDWDDPPHDVLRFFVDRAKIRFRNGGYALRFTRNDARGGILKMLVADAERWLAGEPTLCACCRADNDAENVRAAHGRALIKSLADMIWY
jgi:hypothetical protein